MRQDWHWKRWSHSTRSEENVSLPSHAVNKQRVCRRDKDVITGPFNEEFSKTIVFLHSERGLGGSHCFWPQKDWDFLCPGRPVVGPKKEADSERTLVLTRRKREKAKVQNKAPLTLQYGSPHIACTLLWWAMVWRTRPPVLRVLLKNRLQLSAR